MATKTVKKNETPKITKKWYNFKIDPATLRPVRFSWSLSSGLKEVIRYGSPNKNPQDILNCNLRNTINSYYFVLDKVNKRIFAYPIQLVGHQTRSGCETAHWESINSNTFYMWDENKQLWEIPYREYQKYLGYDYVNHRSRYETVEPKPYKVSRLSTYYYKVQAQLPSYIKQIFSELYGNDFVYQNKLISESEIRDNHWYWISWLNTKGRKYSDKTIKQTDELMAKFSPECRTTQMEGSRSRYSGVKVTLETNNDITALCYFSHGQETFRQIFNAKTGKMNNFIWKGGKWSKTGKLSDWQSVAQIDITDSYRKTHEYDCVFLDEAQTHYTSNKDDVRYWYSPERNLYDFLMNYIAKPVIHQLLQIQNEDSRKEMYKHHGRVSELYGDIPNRGKTMFAKLGINKYQFENPSVIIYVKRLLGTSNISHIDQQTWDKYSKAFCGLKALQYNDNSIIAFLKSKGEFSVDRWIKICELSKKYHTSGGWHSDIIKQLYKDYYSSLSAISEFGADISAYPLLFNNKQQLERYHDEAAAAISAVKNKASDDKLKILYDKRLKMLANDGTHLIEMPKSSADITREGSYLHHCVGGYVNRVANGETAIYFLRQASAPNTPWLTVEVRNNSCIQIHGSCNAWMGSKDEYFAAVPFLVWWFDKHNISYNDNLLTNMATGYSSIGFRRDMPIAKIEAYKQAHTTKKSK